MLGLQFRSKIMGVQRAGVAALPPRSIADQRGARKTLSATVQPSCLKKASAKCCTSSFVSPRMEEMRRLIDAPNSDIFDVLAYVRFTLAPLARTERADAARSSGLGGHELEMRQFLDYVLQAYEAQGVEELSLRKIRDFLRIRYGGTNDAKAVLGSVSEIRKAFIDIQGHLFR